jgi:hypothetical protein
MSNTFVTMVGGGGGGGIAGSGVTTITTNNTSTFTVPAQGGGGVGTYLSSGTTSSPMWVGTTQNANIKVTGNNPTIHTDKNSINLDEVADLVKILKERLLVIIPDFEKHEKYAALKKAYDHYKLIEAMVQEETK